MRFADVFIYPIENETLDSWAKNVEDIAKVSILAFPVVIYGQYGVLFKAINITMLCMVTYSMLYIARFLRRTKK
ncbi:hypothetical protein A1D22_07865 [Pasteurellaceae bacterium LFhippo2]|nr:hypothetical protein [Pasteurellaceae bacterium LFhippo2]